MKYRRIMVAIDNTDEAEHVIQAAVDAASADAEIHLVTIIEPLTNIYGSIAWSPMVSDIHSIEESLTKQSKARLLEICENYGVDGENSHVFLGSAASEIRNAASKLKADLIVIGTHGRHGVGLILGSTANSVLHGVNTDVLVIRL